MNTKKIVPLDQVDDYDDGFELPNSPLKEKYISPDDNSPDFPNQQTLKFIERVKTLPLNMMRLLSHNRTITLDSEDNDSPISKKAIAKISYYYFQGLVNEPSNIQKEQELEAEDAENKETIEEEHERLMDTPHTEHNQFVYITKRPVFDLLKVYTDQYPLLTLRKQLLFIKSCITLFCQKIISKKLFDYLVLMIILWNTIMLFLDDPLKTNDVSNMFDTYFQSFYTIEMSMKIFALGFVWNDGSYLRNGWNVLDFFIVVTGFIPYILKDNVRLSGLRTLRVLRPLKTISSLYYLKLILMSLFSALPMIMNAAFILFFVLLIYAIAALQLFMGTLKRRCFDQRTGLLQLQNFDTSYNGYLCGYDICPNTEINICGKQLATPNSSVTSFDTVLWSLLMMFQEITLENWSINMYYVARTFNYFIVLFFISLAFIGAMIFLNLLASIISQAFEKQSEGMYLDKMLTFKEEKEIPVSIDEIKRLKFCEKYHHKRIDRVRNVSKKYGVLDNYVSIPKPDEIRWQDILDLQMQSLMEKRKTIKPILVTETKVSEVDELLNYIDVAIQKNDFLKTNKEIDYNKKGKKSTVDLKTIFRGSIIIDKPIPRRSGMNLFHGAASKKFGFMNQSPEQFEKPDTTFKKTEENDEKNNDINISKIEKNSEYESQTIKISDKNNDPLHASTFASKTLSKIKMISKFLKKTSKSKEEKKVTYKVIDYMLMVDFSKTYTSDSENDVMVNENLRHKQLEMILLEEKLKNQRCTMKYKTNFIETKELINKNIRKQTKFITQLPKIGTSSGSRMNNPDVLKKLMYGKNLKNSQKIPILGCHNFFIMHKWRKKFKIVDSQRKFHQVKSMFSVGKRKKTKGGKRNKKKEQTMMYQYKDLKFIVKEMMDKEEENEEALKTFTYEDDYMTIKKHDFDHQTKVDFIKDLQINLHWSGEDVYDFKSRTRNLKEVDKIQTKIKKILHSLTTTNQEIKIWLPKFKGKLILARKYLILFIQTQFFENFFLLAVLVNTVVLSLYGYLNTPDQVNTLDTINADLTFVFVAEMGLKIIGYGIVGYVSSLMNVFDGGIVVVSIVDLLMTSLTTNVSAFRAIRILRVFRILRPLHYMKKIISVFTKKFFSFIYICFLLVLLIIIYTLIGAQIYAGVLNNNATGIRQSFNTIYLSFLCVFQLVTIENWNDIETITLYSGVGASLTVFYLLSLIILGNYVFLNLFLGVLIDGFSDNSLLEDEDPFDEEVFNRRKKLEAEKKENEKKDILDEKNYLQMDSEDWDNMLTISSQRNNNKELYIGIECNESLWVFNQKSSVRTICYQIVFHPTFEYFILFLIFCNSIKLGLETYIPTDGSANKLTIVSTDFDIFFNSCFMFEATIKIIAFGFFLDQGSYLRSYWNVLDFIIVVASLLDMILSTVDLPFLKVFRLMRVLRVISHNPNMKMVVMALLQSIVPLFNLIILIFFIFLIFAIMGVTLMGGRMGYCSTFNEYYNVNKTQCIAQGQTWSLYQPNFDNILNALIGVFILSTQEGWPTIMYFAMDGDTEDHGPSYLSSERIGYYFVIALSVLNFFLVNMFVGVLCNQFVEAKENTSPEKNYFISPEQKRWISYQSLILSSNSTKIAPEIPQNKFRLFIFIIVKHKAFDYALMVCIIANIISLGMNYEGASSSYNAALEDINYVFTAVFVMEFLLKIIAYRPKVYMASNWNKFDLMIVVCSLAEIIITQTFTGSVSFLRVGPQIIRIFRVLRVTRVLKLVRKLQSLSKLIETLISALPSIANVGALYLLVYYIFAILGVFFYGNITGNVIDSYNNFQNVWYSFVTCFRMVTGENWWVIMYDCYRTDSACVPGQTCGNAYAPLYFISLQIFQGFVIQSLFILVILKILDEEENPSESFKRLLKEFRFSWNHYTKHTENKKIHSKDLISFFRSLKKELGFEKYSNKRLGVEIMKMHLESDENNYIFFHDVLFETIKRVYGNFNYENLKPETAEYVTKIEMNSRNKLKNHRLKYQIDRRHFFSHNKVVNSNNDGTLIMDESKKKKKIANPLIQMLFLGMVWKTWNSYTRKKVIEHENTADFQDDSDEELKENI